MPVFTVTAVDTGAETLTATGHGLLTGDRFRLRNIGGALPAATPALAPVTDYFAIRVDNDKIKVATSSSNALAGTAVNLTGSGSGTTVVEYGLPYAVRRIAAPGQQVFSIDENETWNSLVALYDLLTGQAQSIWSGVTLAGLLTANAGITLAANQHVTASGTGRFKHGDRTLMIPASAFESDVSITRNFSGYVTLSAVGRLMAPIPLSAGKRIKSATVWYDPQASGGVLPRLLRRTISSGAGNYIWEGSSDNSGSAIESQTGSSLNYTLLDTEFYEFEVAIAGASNRLYGATVMYDEP